MTPDNRPLQEHCANGRIVALPADLLRLSAARAAVRWRARALGTSPAVTRQALLLVRREMQAGRSSGWAVAQALRTLMRRPSHIHPWN